MILFWWHEESREAQELVVGEELLVWVTVILAGPQRLQRCRAIHQADCRRLATSMVLNRPGLDSNTAKAWLSV